MGIFDFLKRKKIEEEQKISFNEVKTLIENKRKDISEKEKEFFTDVKNKISLDIKEITKKLTILENIDVKEKKVEDRVKLIVRENLNNYINQVKTLIESLNNLKEENLETLIKNINDIFSGFDKRSNMSYQKATFIIGKEIAAVRESIGSLSKKLVEIFDENKEIIDTSKTLSLIKHKLNQIDEINETRNKIDERITFFDNELINIKESDNKILENIEEIKKGENYLKNLQKKQEIKLAKEALTKEFFNLKEMIDFKALGNIFHTDKDKMDIIKSHKENFTEVYDGSILNLLEEAELNNNNILTKVEEINDIEKKIKNKKDLIERDETQSLLDESKKIRIDIDNLNNEKQKELKTSNKLKVNKEETIDSIKQELTKINIKVI